MDTVLLGLNENTRKQTDILKQHHKEIESLQTNMIKMMEAFTSKMDALSKQVKALEKRTATLEKLNQTGVSDPVE